MTRERPILFSAPMVRAILDGTKTQTRRVIKGVFESGGMDCIRDWDGGPSALILAPNNWEICPYGVPGDRLWVRETFYCDHYGYDSAATGNERADMLHLMDYRADHDCRAWEAGCPCRDENGRSSWRPSIHMPRWASRIMLEVTEVRVQRVQDISEDDARAEGCIATADWACVPDPMFATEDFRALWDSINAKRGYSWESSPWVWAVTFKRVQP